MNHDEIAVKYDRRYEHTRYAALERALIEYASEAHASSALEVGCGSGHWLTVLDERLTLVQDADPSAEMLARAVRVAPRALLARGRAEMLSWADASVDLVVCINALLHFADVAAFLSEAHRVLRTDGGLFIAGLDPQCDRNSWWIYDYFRARWSSIGGGIRRPATCAISASAQDSLGPERSRPSASRPKCEARDDGQERTPKGLSSNRVGRS